MPVGSNAVTSGYVRGSFGNALANPQDAREVYTRLPAGEHLMKGYAKPIPMARGCGNPGPSGCWAVLYEGDTDNVVWSGHQYLGDNETGNFAKYSAPDTAKKKTAKHQRFQK